MARKKKIIKKGRKDATGTYIVIVSTLILITSIITSYFSIKENNKELERLREVIKTKREKIEGEGGLNETENKLLFLSRLTGWREETPWRTIKGTWTNQDKLRESLNRWMKYLKEAHKIKKYESWPEGPVDRLEKYLNITKLISELEQIIKNNKMRETSSSSERDSARKKKEELIGDITQLRKNKNNEILTLRNSVETIEQRVKGIIKQGEMNVRNLAEAIKNKSHEFVITTEKEEEEITDMTKELNEYADRLSKLKKKLRIAKEGFEVDAEVIVADSVNGYVYLDLGRENAVLKGMEFYVFNIQKGGLRQKKGKVKIIKIYDTYSEAAVVEGTTDPQNPIVVGDLANCQIYSRHKAKSFAFAGKLIGRYTEGDLRKQIQDFGGIIVTEITPDVNYLVAGEGYAQDPVFEKARQLGAVVIREKELYGLLGLKW